MQTSIMEKLKILFLFLLSIVILSILFLYWDSDKFNNLTDSDNSIVAFPYESPDKLQSDLQDIYNSINELSVESRCAKTILELQDSMVIAKNVLEKLGMKKVSPKPVTVSPKATETPGTLEVCPEKFVIHADAFYIDGIPLDPGCHTALPLHTVLTIVFNFVNEIPVENAEILFNDVLMSRYQNVSVLGIFSQLYQPDSLKTTFSKKLPHLKIVNTDKTSQYQVLNEVPKFVDTKYLVLTRNTERFDNFSTIDGLFRPVSYGKADVVSASHRNGTGHWRAGCYQSKMIKYGYRLVEGYDLSYNGCMYCDYVSGPFAIKKELLSHYVQLLSQHLTDEPLYMDLFTILYNDKKVVMSAVDSMFYTKTSGLQVNSKSYWLDYAIKYKINKLIFPDDERFNFSCSEVKLKCTDKRSLPLCCYDELAEFINFISKVFNEKKVKFEVETDLKDGNRLIVSAIVNKEKLSELKPIFEKSGYKWKGEQNDYVEVVSSNWLMNLNSKVQLPKHFVENEDKMESTKIFVGNTWLSTTANPGMFPKTKKGWSHCFERDCGNFVLNEANLEVQDIWV